MNIDDIQPPHCAVNERRVLNLVYVYEGILHQDHRVLDIQEKDFYFEAHRVIYQSMAEAARCGESVNPDTMNKFARRDFVKGSEERKSELASAAAMWLNQTLVDPEPTPDDEREYMKVFKTLRALREIIRHATDLLRACYEQDSSTDLKVFMQPFHDQFDKIAADVGVYLWVPIR